MKKTMNGTKLSAMSAIFALTVAMSQGLMAEEQQSQNQNWNGQEGGQVTEGSDTATGTRARNNTGASTGSGTGAMSTQAQDVNSYHTQSSHNQTIQVLDGESVEVRVEEGGQLDIYKSGDAEVEVHDEDSDDGWFN